MNFGQLTEVDVRECWKHEQYDFSNWLSKSENIDLLGGTIGLTLTDIAKEVYVGSYRCDLVAKDETTGIKVIIENQLEATNHDHLGKLITYASGLDADVIVLIVKEAREEHRSAVEWLNAKTNSEISFFLIEIHAYKIGDSLPAPQFVIVEKPNNFVKATKGISDDNELSRAQAERLYFWTCFNEALIARGKPFNVRKATTDHWYDVAIGTSQAHLSISLVNRSSSIWIELYIRDNKSLFDQLKSYSDEIEDKLGFALDWRRLDDRKASRIVCYLNGLNFENHDNYGILIDDVITKVTSMREVFKHYL